MKYYHFLTLGEEHNRDLVFLDKRPPELVAYSHYPARGKRIGENCPSILSLTMQPESPGLKLETVVGNTFLFMVVATAMKDVILDICDSEIEVYPVILYNHKNRVHSEDYWIVNPIGTHDCFHEGASKIIYGRRNPEKIALIQEYALDRNKMSTAPDLFRIPEDISEYFISERLANAFKENNFTNVVLKEIDIA